MNPLLKLGLLVWLLVAASACGGDEDSPDASPTPTLVVTAATSVPTLPPAAPTTTIPPTPTTAPVESTTAPLPGRTTVLQPQPTALPPTAVPAGPVTLSITARALAFNRTSITVPANTSVTVNFSNEDTLVAHDFGVSIPFVPHTETCNGPCTARLTFNSGPPGSYTFQCSVHADMVGTFIVN